MRKIIAIGALAASLAGGAALAGCGASQPVTYAPAAYGVSGQCYYVQDPAEAVALENAGLCPRSWVPTLMPLYWHEEYYGYYDSPVYYSRYVPASHRTVYVSRQRSFGSTYKSRITAVSGTATYRGSNGTTAKGARVAKAQFGSGTSGTSFGGGSRGKTGTSGSGTSGKSRSGSGISGGSRSGGFGGGSRSGGRH
jgi:hypothetical protein